MKTHNFNFHRYGSRSTTEECPEGIFVMCIQSVTGVMVQAFMVGIVFAKLARPKQRAQTLLFSRNAVVCLRDGELCLMFRVGDMRKSHIISATVRAQLVRTRTTKEGEVLHQHQAELKIGTDGGDNNLFFIWPMTVVHRIDCESPLYNISANDIIDRESRFEIILFLEGKCIMATHMLRHASTINSKGNLSLFTLRRDMGIGYLPPFISNLSRRWRSMFSFTLCSFHNSGMSRW